LARVGGVITCAIITSFIECLAWFWRFSINQYCGSSW